MILTINLPVNQEDKMRLFLFVVLTIASIWDTFTTVYATLDIFGTGLLQVVAALLFAALIMSFMLNTRRIMQWRSGFVGGIIKLFWFVALASDFYTAWIGNSNLLTRGQESTAELILLTGLTLLVTASPILLSVLWERRDTFFSSTSKPLSGETANVK
jgi:hypothetical protein